MQLIFKLSCRNYTREFVAELVNEPISDRNKNSPVPIQLFIFTTPVGIFLFIER